MKFRVAVKPSLTVLRTPRPIVDTTSKIDRTSYHLASGRVQVTKYYKPLKDMGVHPVRLGRVQVHRARRYPRYSKRSILFDNSGAIEADIALNMKREQPALFITKLEPISLEEKRRALQPGRQRDY